MGAGSGAGRAEARAGRKGQGLQRAHRLHPDPLRAGGQERSGQAGGQGAALRASAPPPGSTPLAANRALCPMAGKCSAPGSGGPAGLGRTGRRASPRGPRVAGRKRPTFPVLSPRSPPNPQSWTLEGLGGQGKLTSG